MFCERPYGRPDGSRDAIRLYRDPSDQCVMCEGRGFTRSYDAATQFSHAECPACLAESTEGYFLVRVQVGRVSLERSWQTTSFPAAVAQAERYARLLRAVFAFRGAPSEVTAVYVPTDPEATREDEEDVHAVTVWESGPRRAA